MVRTLIVIVFLWLSPTEHRPLDHAIYISVMEITLPSRFETGTILIKTFSDDLQNALHHTDPGFNISTNPCDENALISSYTSEHIHLKVEENQIEFMLKDCQVISDSHWLTFEFDIEYEIEKIKIESDWLIELFPTQSNIIRVKNGDRIFFERLSMKKTKAIIEMN